MSQWVCGTCTFHNSAGTATCTMCQSGERPAAAVAPPALRVQLSSTLSDMMEVPRHEARAALDDAANQRAGRRNLAAAGRALLLAAAAAEEGPPVMARQLSAELSDMCRVDRVVAAEVRKHASQLIRIDDAAVNVIPRLFNAVGSLLSRGRHGGTKGRRSDPPQNQSTRPVQEGTQGTQRAWSAAQ